MSYEIFKEKYNIQANRQQEAAIKKTDGPVLLLAVPGSGKTTVIVGRTGYMICEEGIDPKNILVITFTTAAAREMEERFKDKFQLDVSPHFSTINSFCLTVINYCKRYKGFEQPELVTNNLSIIREIIMELTKEYPDEPTVRFCSSAIGYIKNNMEENNCFKKVEKDPNNDGKLALKVYTAYLKYMKQHNIMDFDDQLIFANELLKRHSDVLEFFQDRYRYISVDEAQDTSLIQHAVIKKLAARYHNIFMVGDEDQSIYEFRGAFPEALLEFKKDYPGASELFMSVNYRSTKTIVDCAESFISQNKTRTKKYMKTDNEEGEIIKEEKLPSIESQYRYILDLVKNKKKDESFAVLARDNAALMPLMSLFFKENIRFNCRDDTAPFIFSFEVSDCINFIKLGLNKRDIEAFSKIYYKLGLYLSKSDFSLIERLVMCSPDKDILSILQNELNVKDKRTLDNFIRTLNNVPTVSPKVILMQFTERTGYADYLKEKKKNKENTLNTKLNALLAIAQETNTAEEFLDAVEEVSTRKKYKSGSDITLTTMHSAKGMEFDTVVIINAIQNILPSFEAIQNSDYESDVRLFYVAATRAKKRLIFITSKRWFGKDINPSSFVQRFITKRYASATIRQPINFTKPQSRDKYGFTEKRKKAPVIYTDIYTVGKRVKHFSFGEGEIVSCNNTVIKVNFSKCGIKILGTQFVYDNDLLKLIK